MGSCKADNAWRGGGAAADALPTLHALTGYHPHTGAALGGASAALIPDWFSILKPVPDWSVCRLSSPSRSVEVVLLSGGKKEMRGNSWAVLAP